MTKQRIELELAVGPGGWVQAELVYDGRPSGTRVWVRLRLAGDDRWEPQGTLYVPGLDPASLRTLPLRRILAAVEANEPLRRDLHKRLEDAVPGEPRTFEFAKAFSGLIYEGLPPLKRPRGRRLTDDFYGAVASLYRAAQERGLNPRTAVAEAAGTSTDVAGRWVREARKRGQLPPTTPGRARA